LPTPSLQEAIDQAGSPVRLLWRRHPRPWTPPVVEPEYAGWREEQAASNEGVALSDLSHHMSDLFIAGPDAGRLLSDVGANNLASFELGQAKQFIAVTEEGHLVSDGILMREDADRYTLSGAPASQNWVRYHGERGNYDVSFASDPDSAHRDGRDPVVFRFQIQGPNAPALAERVLGGPLPQTRFFHSAPVTLAGRSFRALRHGMTGQPGYELIGDYADGAFVLDALVSAGVDLGLVRVGGLAYSTNGIESGWIPTQTPGIYSAPALRPYREHLSLSSYEGQKPLSGSYFSERIDDYYCSPYELGYGRSVSFNHDFVGRAALERAKEHVARAKVTLVLDAQGVREAVGDDTGFFVTYGRHRVERDGVLVGMTCHIASIAPANATLGLALVLEEHASPGTAVEVVWGEHPGPGTDPDAELGFPRIRATVAPSPYNEFARTQYRKDA